VPARQSHREIPFNWLIAELTKNLDLTHRLLPGLWKRDLTSLSAAVTFDPTFGSLSFLGTRVFAAGRRQGSGCKSRAAAQL